MNPTRVWIFAEPKAHASTLILEVTEARDLAHAMLKAADEAEAAEGGPSQ